MDCPGSVSSAASRDGKLLSLRSEFMPAGEVTPTASTLESPHERTSSSFGFIAVPPPELRLIVKVTEKKTDVPVRDVEVRLGPYRGSTDDLGSAKVELPKGAYDLVVWKLGYRALEKAVEVTADTTVQVEIELDPEPEQE